MITNGHRSGIRAGLAALIVTTVVLMPRLAETKPKTWLYISPLPNSQMILPQNNIIMRSGKPIDPASLQRAVLSVIGTKSGSHTGDLLLTDDGETVVFNPHTPFVFDETVSVWLRRKFRTLDKKPVPKLRFEFATTAYDRNAPGNEGDLAMMARHIPSQFRLDYVAPIHPDPAASNGVNPCKDLPQNYPEIRILELNDPDPGYLFLSPFVGGVQGGDLVILDNYGLPVYHGHSDGPGFILDFKLLDTGLLSAVNFGDQGIAILDSSYNVVDRLTPGNGYLLDGHDFIMLDNGHCWIMGTDLQKIRMDLLYPGGDPEALVVAEVFQELDGAGNVVFQWREWDYYDILDMDPREGDFTDSEIDPFHANSMDVDDDGNLLISVRHLNEITKINRRTGDIIWRMGLHASKNQFTFVNDTRGFTHTHDVRRLPNGNVSLFDNSNFLEPQYSRALEFELDEVNKVATLVWEYRNTPDTFGGFMGSVQRRQNGGTTICWGGVVVGPRITDLKSDGTKSFEIGFPPRTWSYRAHRRQWRTNRFVTEPMALDFGDVAQGASATLPLAIRNNSPNDVEIGCFVSSNDAFTVDGPGPFVLGAGESHTVQVRFTAGAPGVEEGNLHVRQVRQNELVAQVVEVRGKSGIAKDLVSVGTVPSSLSLSHPNPTSGKTLVRFEIPSTGLVTLKIFDARGRLVETLVNHEYQGGRYSTNWDARGASPGLYFARLEHGDRSETSRFVLLD